MTGRAILAPQARTEFLAMLRRIGENNPAAAERSKLVVDKTAHRLGERPRLGRIEPSLARLRDRFWSIPAFSVLMVYDAELDPVQILRIVHTAQDLPKLLKELSSS